MVLDNWAPLVLVLVLSGFLTKELLCYQGEARRRRANRRQQDEGWEPIGRQHEYLFLWVQGAPTWYVPPHQRMQLAHVPAEVAAAFQEDEWGEWWFRHPDRQVNWALFRRAVRQVATLMEGPWTAADLAWQYPPNRTLDHQCRRAIQHVLGLKLAEVEAEVALGCLAE